MVDGLSVSILGLGGCRVDVPIRVVVHPAVEGGYWAEVPALPGCFTGGETLDELRANAAEAIAGWIEAANRRACELGEHDAGPPQDIVL
jgi:predicted RNase H-like HicB family nuclease